MTRQTDDTRTTPVIIERIGSAGDGVGQLTDGSPVYVPFTLPGETVRVRLGRKRGRGTGGEAVERLTEAPERVTPPCPHFGHCGGCAVQHLAQDAYDSWKRALVVEALMRRGLGEASVADLIVIPPGTRRRARFSAESRHGAVAVGFHKRRGRRVVDIASCALLTPALAATMVPLRRLCAELLRNGERLTLQVLDSETGLDLVIARQRPLDLAERERLAAFAEEADIASLAWDDEGLIARRREVRVSFDGISVSTPPGAFLQPSCEGEAAIRATVTAGLGDAKVIADLFSGCGTLAIPLARNRKVHTVDNNAAAEPDETRDLFARPLTGDELARFDAVIIDPPRAGAHAQAHTLATSTVPCVIAVSCDPGTFARDARSLVDGGYAIETITPIDQFPWSAELELVAVFRRV
ncbi:MAG: TRAM domain-containing protein [Alphaproteobacteria bacterium]|nr:TRAM domain-containing protein [Alphaproteobacteria bacterium]